MGEGRPLVLLHGLFGAASNWGRVQRRLAENCLVLALDARNHGSSPHDPAFDYRAMAQDVLDTLDAEGIDAAAVVGHSMGGKTAMHLALAVPQRVERMVVADIAPVTYEPHFRAIAAAMQAMPLRSGLTRAEANAALETAAPEPEVRGFLLQNLRFGDKPSWRIGLDEIAAGLPAIERWDGAGTYAGPVLVLRGERSPYVRAEHRPLFRALFPAARFASLRDAGHWLHADAPDAFVDTVRAFLRVG
jgi:pimeloyl-ACP methyl ester carboxylesterase